MRIALPIHSLRAKLLLFSLLLVVVPGAIFALIAFVGAHRALEHAVGRQLAEVADDATDEIVEAVGMQVKDVHLWAKQDLMRAVLTGDADRHLSRYLATVKETRGRFRDVLCADRNGVVIAASDRRLFGASHIDRIWFQNALKGKDTVAGPLMTPDYESPIVEIAAPLRDPKHPEVIVGGVLGVYDWARSPELTERVRRSLAGLGMSVDLLILDEHGIVIAAPQTGPFGALEGKNLRAAGWAAAQRRPPTPRRGYMLEPQAAALVGYARLKKSPPRWSAVAVEPLHEALAPVYRMQQRLAMLLTAVLLGGLGVATILADRMSRPLRELTQATREIASAGSIRSAVAVRSQDEIGQLATAFNTMAADLKRAQDDLTVAAKFAFIGEVAAGVAHEVRTPLAIMRSSAQLLGRSLPPGKPETSELVETLIDEVDRLDRVVAGLLQLARPHVPLIEPTRLEPVLERALDFIDAPAREKRLTLRRDFAPNTRPALCDPDDIYQVALNLIVNALQILPTGGEIVVRTLPPADGRTAFEVHDNGPGIAADDLERIFTPFFTLREGGTGLGLALVQRVVQGHKGSVAVESTPGHGTTFRIELPGAEVSI